MTFQPSLLDCLTVKKENIMKLFAAPKTTTLEDGSVRIEAQAITTEYIDSQIETIEAVGKLNIDEVIKVIRGSKDLDEAKINLMSKFDLVDDVADFVLEMELSEMDNYLNNAEFRNTEVAKLRALKETIG